MTDRQQHKYCRDLTQLIDGVEGCYETLAYGARIRVRLVPREKEGKVFFHILPIQFCDVSIEEKKLSVTRVRYNRHDDKDHLYISLDRLRGRGQMYMPASPRLGDDTLDLIEDMERMLLAGLAHNVGRAKRE